MKKKEIEIYEEMFELDPFRDISKNAYDVFVKSKVPVITPFTYGVTKGIGPVKLNKKPNGTPIPGTSMYVIKRNGKYICEVRINIVDEN